MRRIGMLSGLHMAAMAMALMEPPRPQVIVTDDPPKPPDVGPEEVFAFYGNSSGEFRSTKLPRRRPPFYKPNGAREQARRRRQREKREAKNSLNIQQPIGGGET